MVRLIQSFVMCVATFGSLAIAITAPNAAVGWFALVFTFIAAYAFTKS